jgi:hypothetical protein
MKRIFVPTQSGSDWQRLLAKPTLHWKVGRSAMCAAAAWEDAGDKLPLEIANALDAVGVPELQSLQLLAAIPEWGVPLPGGDRASFTDVLALTRNDEGLCIVGVEAKVDEDFGPLIREKQNGASAGQLERLKYLQDLLGCKFDGTVRYQLLHRTASALLTARDFHAQTAVMLIHSFGRADLRKDFDAFCAALKAKKLTADVYGHARSARPKLYLAWVDGDRRFTTVDVPAAIAVTQPMLQTPPASTTANVQQAG